MIELRDTPTLAASSDWLQPRSRRSDFIRFFIGCYSDRDIQYRHPALSKSVQTICASTTLMKPPVKAIKTSFLSGAATSPRLPETATIAFCKAGKESKIAMVPAPASQPHWLEKRAALRCHSSNF